MRLNILIVASAAVLALSGCKKPAEDHAEEPGDVVAAGAVTDPAAATVTMDQAAADDKAADAAGEAADAAGAAADASADAAAAAGTAATAATEASTAAADANTAAMAPAADASMAPAAPAEEKAAH